MPIQNILYPIRYSIQENQSHTKQIIPVVKEKRKILKYTQIEIAEKAGVGLRFIRELEQGKKLYEWTKSIRSYGFWDMSFCRGRKTLRNDMPRKGKVF